LIDGRTTGVLTRRDALIVGADSEMTAPRVMEAVVDKAAGAVDHRAVSTDQARQHEQRSSNSKLVPVAAAIQTRVSMRAQRLIRTAEYVGKEVIFGRCAVRQYCRSAVPHSVTGTAPPPRVFSNSAQTKTQTSLKPANGNYVT